MAGVQCTISTFKDEPHWMLKIIQYFVKNWSCHFQNGSTNEHQQIHLATYCLPYIKLPKCPTITYLSWRWQLQCFPKHWIILKIWCSSSLNAKIIQWNGTVKYQRTAFRKNLFLCKHRSTNLNEILISTNGTVPFIGLFTQKHKILSP
jgi:hypothetical protein